MRIRSALFLTLGLCLLAGCGGGGGSVNSIPTGSQKTGGQKAATAYTITDLGAADYYYYYGYYFDGLNRGAAVQINDLGQVVSGTGPNALVWRNGETKQLSSYWSSASDLNNNNQIVGIDTSSGCHAVLWTNGTPTDLGTISPDYSYYSQANGINDIGQVVGASSTYSNNTYGYHAFLSQNGKMTDLGTIAGDYSIAAHINHAGQVVGWSTVPGGQYYWYPVHAFVWQNGKMTDLGTLSGGTASDASAINASGVIVGSSTTPPQGLYNYRTIRAVAWVNEAIQDLGTLGGAGSIAFDINDAGQIVGSADTTTVNNQPNFWQPFGTGGAGNNGGPPGAGGAGGNGGSGGGANQNGNPGGTPISSGAGGGLPNRSAAKPRSGSKTRGIGDTYVAHAFVYANGQMTDLNIYLPANSGWELIQATGINNSGQIVGYGTLNQRVHAFLLSPASAH